MPETSLDWLAMTLVGFGLLTVGFILRAGKPLA
jgi:hypothetical protein